jgi:hypothetical protein
MKLLDHPPKRSFVVCDTRVYDGICLKARYLSVIIGIELLVQLIHAFFFSSQRWNWL